MLKQADRDDAWEISAFGRYFRDKTGEQIVTSRSMDTLIQISVSAVKLC